jgi:hypothetical protein
METKKPTKTFRARGVSAAIWNNESKDGQEFSTVSLKRSYKDEKGEWCETQTLRKSDLPAAATVLQEAYKFLAVSVQ